MVGASAPRVWELASASGPRMRRKRRAHIDWRRRHHGIRHGRCDDSDYAESYRSRFEYLV